METNFRIQSQTLKAIYVGLLLVAIGFGFFLPSIMMAGGDDSSIWLKFTPLLLLGGGGVIAFMGFTGQNQASQDAKNPLLLIAIGGIALTICGLMLFDAITEFNPDKFEGSNLVMFGVLILAGLALIALGLQQIYKLSALRGSQLAFRGAATAAIAFGVTLILIYLMKEKTESINDLEFGDKRAKSYAETIARYTGLIFFCIFTLIPASIATAAFGVRFIADSAKIEEEEQAQTPATPAE